MRNRHGGLTLIECLIAMAILAVIAAWSVPGLGRLIADTRSVAAANALLAALQHARATAWTRNTPWALCLTADGQRCITARDRQARGWLVLPLAQLGAASDATGPASDMPGLGVTLLNAGLYVRGTRPAVAFWPRSRSGTTATLSICPARPDVVVRAVIISQTGRPRLTRSAYPAGCA